MACTLVKVTVLGFRTSILIADSESSLLAYRFLMMKIFGQAQGGALMYRFKEMTFNDELLVLHNMLVLISNIQKLKENSISS